MFWLALISLVVAVIWTAFIIAVNDASDNTSVHFMANRSLIPIWILAAVLIAVWAFN